MRLGMTIINLSDTTVETPKVEGAGPLRVFWDIFSEEFLGVVKKSMEVVPDLCLLYFNYQIILQVYERPFFLAVNTTKDKFKSNHQTHSFALSKNRGDCMSFVQLTCINESPIHKTSGSPSRASLTNR